MSLNVFLELVEIKAKTASILPMLLGVCLSVYYYHSLNLMNSVLFFIAMLLFNMAVDMMDNYNDYNQSYNYSQNNQIDNKNYYEDNEELSSLDRYFNDDNY